MKIYYFYKPVVRIGRNLSGLLKSEGRVKYYQSVQ